MKGKGKDKKESGGRQTTLFGLPSVSAPEKEKKAPGRKKKAQSGESQQSTTTVSEETQILEETQLIDDSQVTEINIFMDTDTQVDEASSRTASVPTTDKEGEEGEEPIDWPASPAAETVALPVVDVGAS